MGEALGRPWGLTPFEGNKRLAKLIGIVANRGKLYLWMLAVEGSLGSVGSRRWLMLVAG